MLTDILQASGPISIRAAAGTGKTFTLTRKILHRMLEEGVEPEQILALTFTDLAAAEMRSRVYEGLEKAASRERAEHLKARFHRNRISTIHSFCLDLLKAWPDRLAALPFDADGELPPIRCVRPVRLMDTHQAVQLQAEWKRAFYAHFKEWAPLTRLLMRYGLRDVEAACKEAADVTDGRLRALSELGVPEWVALIRRLAEPLIAERDTHWEAWLALVRANPGWFVNPDAMPADVHAMAATPFLTGKGKTIGKRSVTTKQADNHAVSEVFQRAWDLHLRIAVTETWLAGGAPCGPDADDPDAIAYLTIRDLAQVVIKWRSWFLYQRVKAGQFVFDDFIRLASRLLEEDAAWRAQVAGGFRQILVDEFQDTDRVQWSLISSLVEAGCEDVLVVGDIKQAIYEFRGGNVSVFDRAVTGLGGRGFDLSTSWRSLPEVIAFANICFREVFKDASAVYEARAQDLVPNDPAKLKEDPKRDPAGTVTEVRFEQKPGSREPRSRWEAESLASFLCDIRDGKRPEYAGIGARMRAGEKAVGILFRARSRQGAFEWAFRQAGLPFVNQGGSGFYGRPESWDVLNLMRVLLDADDDFALVGVLRSPLVGMSDDGLVALKEAAGRYGRFRSVLLEARYDGESDREAAVHAADWLFGGDGLRNQVSVRRVSDVLSTAFFESAYLEAAADPDQVAANLRKAIDIVRDLEANGTGTLMDVTEFWLDRVDAEEDESQGIPGAEAPIRMLSMHGSKGLEFPMVVLADLDGQPGGDRGVIVRSPQDTDPDEAFVMIRAKNPDMEDADAAEGPFKRDGCLYDHLKTENRKRSEAELKRLFYVAVTRASEHLVLWGTAEKPYAGSAGVLWDSVRDVCLDAGVLRTQPLVVPAAQPSAGAAAGAARAPASDRAAVAARLATAARTARRPSAHGEAARDAEDDGTRPTAASPWAGLASDEAGNAIHAAIQVLGWERAVPDASIRRLLSRLAPQAGTADLDRLADHVRRARTWLSDTFRAGVRLKRHEMAFDVETEDGFWRGIIDLYVSDADGNSWIIDFKTGDPDHADLDVYGRQLVAYQAAVAALGLPAAHPDRTLLLFTDAEPALARSLSVLL